MAHPSWFAGAIVALGSLVASPPATAEDPRLDGYRVAPGWKLAIAGTEPLVVNPVSMTFGPDGRLYVIEWKAGRGPNDRIQALADADGDGEFDEASTFMDGLDLPAGLLFWDGWAYVTLDHDVVRFRDDDGDGRFEFREAVVTGFPHNNSHHRVSGMAIGPDGWLYLSAGDGDAHARGSDGSEATLLRSGGIFRCRPDGSHLEVFALGMRNPWGNLALDDEGRAFHTDNDSESTPSFTGCRLLHVVEGGDYGWRVREGALCCTPDPERSTWNGGRPGRLGWIAETGRGAPAGLCVLNSGAFPPTCRNLLIYPDVFRKRVRAYALKPSGATFAVDRETELLASDDGLFRPNDAEVGPDGALYILDWRTDSGGASQLAGNGTTGRIYRMTWGGTADEPARPTFPPGRFVRIEKATEDALFDGLASDDHGARVASAREVARRVATPGADARRIWARAAKWIVDKDRSIPSRALLLSLAGGMGPSRGAPEVDPSRYSAEPAIRRLAYAAIRPDGEPTRLPSEAVIARMLRANEADPAIAREQAMALGRIGRERPGGETAIATKLMAMTLALRDADPVARDGIVRGLERLGPAGLDAVVRTIADANSIKRNVGRFSLQSWRGPDGLAAILDVATSPLEIPANDRANLFRGLRELGPAVPADRVAKWLETQPRADLPPRIEAIRLLASMGPRAGEASGPILGDLLDDDAPEVRRAALGLAASTRPESARSPLLAAALDEFRAADERLLALSALRGYRDRTQAPAIAEALRKATDPGFRGEALRTLAALDFALAVPEAKRMLSDPNPSVRSDAIAVLGQKPGSALDLVRAYEAGTMPREDVSKVIEAARRHDDPAIRAALVAPHRDRMRGLSGPEEAGKLEDQARRLGNPARGKALFLDPAKANCASCHRVEGVGGSVGPDLTRIWETMSFAKRAESILDPSREIKEGYATSKVATVDGRVVSGLLLSDNADGITLRDAKGLEVRIPAAEVEEKGSDATSLMPDGLIAPLSYDEFLDLLAFLGDRREQESLRASASSKP